MDVKEKRILISLISSVLIMGLYAWYVYGRYIAGNPEILNDFSFWGKSFLILIPIAIITWLIFVAGDLNKIQKADAMLNFDQL